MAAQSLNELLCMGIPQFKLSVIAASGEYGAIFTECQCPYLTPVTLQGKEQFAIIGVPDLDGAIVTPAYDVFSVRAKGYRTYLSSVAR
jgi:hypothetical protein